MEKVFGLNKSYSNFFNKYDLYMADLSHHGDDYKKLVVLERPRCETDSLYAHFATYCIVQNEKGEILTYKRNKRSTEQRLHDLWSIGVGGHVQAKYEDNLETILNRDTSRELYEELYNCDDNCSDNDLHIESKGMFIMYTNTDEVSSNHIAVVSRCSFSKEQVNAFNFSDELKDHVWLHPDELISMKEKDEMFFESWSDILLDNFYHLPGNNNPEHSVYGEYPFREHISIAKVKQ